VESEEVVGDCISAAKEDAGGMIIREIRAGPERIIVRIA
jgi:hypothetical protein